MHTQWLALRDCMPSYHNAGTQRQGAGGCRIWSERIVLTHDQADIAQIGHSEPSISQSNSPAITAAELQRALLHRWIGHQVILGACPLAKSKQCSCLM